MGTLVGLLVGALASTAASNWAVQISCSCTQAGGALEKQAGGALEEQAGGASEEQAGGALEKQAGGAFGGTGMHWEAHCDGADAPATNGPSSCLGAGLASRLGGASCTVPDACAHCDGPQCGSLCDGAGASSTNGRAGSTRAGGKLGFIGRTRCALSWVCV